MGLRQPPHPVVPQHRSRLQPDDVGDLLPHRQHEVDPARGHLQGRRRSLHFSDEVEIRCCGALASPTGTTSSRSTC
eukprot:749240-Hanusia_phi.AAC.2